MRRSGWMGQTVSRLTSRPAFRRRAPTQMDTTRQNTRPRRSHASGRPSPARRLSRHHRLPRVHIPDTDPQRALFPKGTRAFQALAFHYFQEQVLPLIFPLMLFKIDALQTDGSRTLFRAHYEGMYGKSIEQAVPTGVDREEARRKVRAAFERLGSFIEKDEGRGDDTPFFAGRNICFFDLHTVAALRVMKLGLGDEFKQEVGGCGNGRWVRLLAACSGLTD